MFRFFIIYDNLLNCVFKTIPQYYLKFYKRALQFNINNNEKW